MDFALEKSISLVLFIVIGILLKKRISKADEVNGLKHLILTLALPATIFIALLKINIDDDLLVLPFMALLLNIALFYISPLILAFIGISKGTPQANTARLLIPSLAPGLSCFPFILEFLGDGYLAKAAMADLGNKFFVLFVLYLVALKWFYRRNTREDSPAHKRLVSLFKTMITEPVNMFIIAALILLGLGINFESLPSYISSTLNRLSLIMTPVVLLFIGLAIKIRKRQFVPIFSLLLLRSAVVLFIAVAVVSLLNITLRTDILFILAFSLSACSFWPFAHIAGIRAKEKELHSKEHTFDPNMALSILALSLPMSVLLILSIFTFQDNFTEIRTLLILACALLALGVLPSGIKKIREMVLSKSMINLKPGWLTSNSELD